MEPRREKGFIKTIESYWEANVILHNRDHVLRGWDRLQKTRITVSGMIHCQFHDNGGRRKKDN